MSGEDDALDVAEMLPEPIRLSAFASFLQRRGALKNGCPVCGGKAFSTTARRLGGSDLATLRIEAELQDDDGQTITAPLEFVISTCMDCAATQFFSVDTLRGKMEPADG